MPPFPAIRELRTEAGGELQGHGSGVLFRWLLDNDLVDEINLFTFPVVVGQGTRLFPETGKDVALELVGTRTTPTAFSGLVAAVPNGRPRRAASAGGRESRERSTASCWKRECVLIWIVGG